MAIKKKQYCKCENPMLVGSSSVECFECMKLVPKYKREAISKASAEAIERKKQSHKK